MCALVHPATICPPFSLSVAAAVISHRTILLSLSSAVIRAREAPALTHAHTCMRTLRWHSTGDSSRLGHTRVSTATNIREWEPPRPAVIHFWVVALSWFVTRALCSSYGFDLYPETSAHTLIDCYLSVTMSGWNTHKHAGAQTRFPDTISSPKALLVDR